MNAVPIEPLNLAEIDGWRRRRDSGLCPDGLLPTTGFWVPGVLAAWLYRSDSKVAFAEEFIGNPDVSSEQRREAMLLVSEAIADTARAEGFYWLRGLTTFETVAQNGRDVGYVVSEPKYRTMLLALNGVTQ